MEPEDWIFLVGDGNNFITSSKYKVWAISLSTNKNAKKFVKTVKKGDRMWFVTTKSKGKVIAMSIYESHNKREFGDLINMSITNEELGWIGDEWSIYDTEIHYSNLYNLNHCDLFTNIQGPPTVRKYNEKCLLNLPLEYEYITKYSKIKSNM